MSRVAREALSNLLGADPATRAQRVWEAAAQCPPPDATSTDSDPRIAATQAGLDMLHELKPIMRVIHDDEAGSIAEDFDLLALSFRAYQYTGMASVPSYVRWLFGQEMTAAFALHRQVLQLLSWRHPPHRWHLRNPATLLWVDAVVAVHPDARFVWCHRDPSAVLASVCELVAEVRDLASDHVALRRLGAEQLEDWARLLDAGMAARNRLGPDRFVDVWHEDVVADPMATLATVYERVGWTWTPAAEAAARAWTDAHARGAHGEHHPDLAHYNLTRDGVRDRMADYCRRFEV